MDHRLVAQVEKALAWDGPHTLGTAFGIGTMPDTDLCDRLLNPDKLLSLLLRRRLDYPQVRCLQQGTDLHPTAYLETVATSRGQQVRAADPRRIGGLLKEGCTLVVDNLGPLDSTLEIACRALSWWAGEPARVNAYLTTGQASGWGLHWDSHDVLCVQLAGEKSWEVRGPSRPAPMDRDTTPNLEPSSDIVWSGTMRAGDVMHIPRGWWHQATRADQEDTGFSLHATFGLTQRTGADWLSWVAEQARAEELFRTDLPGADARRADLTAAAAHLLNVYSPSDFLAGRAQARPGDRQVTTFGVFGGPTAVVCVTDLPPHIETHDDKVVLLAAGKRITLPAEALPVLRTLLSGLPVALGDLTAATEVDPGQLIDVLLAHGICAEVTADLIEGFAGMSSE